MRHTRPIRGARLGALKSATKPYAGSGVGYDMPAGSTVIGYKNINKGSSLNPQLVPVWVGPAPAAGSGGGQAPTVNVSSPVNVAVPTTTQITTAVSPSMNVAAGSQGVQQGASTGQQAAPVSTDTVPQSSATGLAPADVQKLLEQQKRESDALAAERAGIAAKQAELNAALAAAAREQQLRQEYEARIKAVEQANQKPSAPQAQTQEAPVMLPPAPAPAPAPAPVSAPVPVPAPAQATGQTGTNGVKTGLLIGLASLALFMMQPDKQHGHRKTRR